MSEKRIINQYREVSLSLSMTNQMLKKINRDLKRVKHPCKHRNILLHERLQLNAMKNSLRRSISVLAEQVSIGLINSALV